MTVIRDLRRVASESFELRSQQVYARFVHKVLIGNVCVLSFARVVHKNIKV